MNEFGIKICLVNIPFTYPPEPLAGFMVCGFGTPNLASDIAYPPEVKAWISKNFRDSKPEVDTQVLATASPDEIFIAEKDQQLISIQIAVELSVQYEVNVLVLNLMFPNHANHKMPKMEQVKDAYCQTDRDLSKLIEMFCPDNVMIFSDHGFSRIKGDFMLDAWLRDHGYYVTLENTPSEKSAVFNWMLKEYFRDHLGWSGITEKFTRRLIKESFFKIPKRLRWRFWRKFEAVFPFGKQYLRWSGKPDYTSTQVFPGSVFSGLLYMNLADRESSGTIPPRMRKIIRKEISSKLLKIVDPEFSKPLFSNVYFADDLYDGPEERFAPDLILDGYQNGWKLKMRKDYFPSPPKSVVDSYFITDAKQRDFGWHTVDGVFTFSGSAFSEGVPPFAANLMDIPATLLHLYEIPIPEAYDGKVLTVAMSNDHGTRPVKYQPADRAKRRKEDYTSDESDSLVSHLRAPGYLE